MSRNHRYYRKASTSDMSKLHQWPKGTVPQDGIVTFANAPQDPRFPIVSQTAFWHKHRFPSRIFAAVDGVPADAVGGDEDLIRLYATAAIVAPHRDQVQSLWASITSSAM
jgi:hypothetical protein